MTLELKVNILTASELYAMLEKAYCVGMHATAGLGKYEIGKKDENV